MFLWAPVCACCLTTRMPCRRNAVGHALGESRTLWVLATLDDTDIFTKATGDLQRLWELGDVFEIFLEAEGCGQYCETHITPGKFRMHLRLTSDDFTAMKKRTPGFCRSDAWSDGRAPVLSSTSPHREANFHRRQEWRPICF